MGALAELSLFSGYGGFTLGLRLARIPIRTVCYVEINPYRQEIIKARIRDGFLDDAPIWDDARTFDGVPWNLWPDTVRIIREVRPRFVLLENVPGIAFGKPGRPAYVRTVLGELAEAGYDAVWDRVAAAEIGAPHLRWRWWCLAWDPDRLRREAKTLGGKGEDADTFREGGRDGHGADPDGKRCAWGSSLQETPREAGFFPAEGGGTWWASEPGMGRVAHGVAHRVDRLAALGDGVVPAVVAEFLRRAVGWIG